MMRKPQVVLTALRLKIELRTLVAMLDLSGLDEQERSELLRIGTSKLRKCVFSWKKPVCSACKTNCYSEKQRLRMKNMMARSGPRLIYHHPFLSLFHLLSKAIPATEYKPKSFKKVVERTDINKD